MSEQESAGVLGMGKLPPERLARMLQRLPGGASVLQGPGPGLDAAAVEPGGGTLVLAADPMTFTAIDAGRSALLINANDVACLGAEPRWFLATILLPPGSTEVHLGALFAELGQACADTGVTLVGGHTEVTDAVVRPVIAGCMVGEADRLIRSSGAQPGDVLIQAGRAAVEGTALLAIDLQDRLWELLVPQDDIYHGANLLFTPGISVLPAARILRAFPDVHAMHDPTEGGIATAVAEMADAAGLGVTLDGDAVAFYRSTESIADALGIDPLGLLASGTLLAAVAPGSEGEILDALRRARIVADPIGVMGAQGDPPILVLGDTTRPLPRFPMDEALRVLPDGR